MDTVEFIRDLDAHMRRLVDDAMQDTTIAQFNWAPPGTASPISAIFLHLLTSEDYFIQSVLQGKPRLWESAGWSNKTGVKDTPDFGGNWGSFKQMSLDMEPMVAYQAAVRLATDAYLDSLTLVDLERKVKFAGRMDTVAYIFTHTICHTISHAGEIAALKGVQGVKGLPY